MWESSSFELPALLRFTLFIYITLHFFVFFRRASITNSFPGTALARVWPLYPAVGFSPSIACDLSKPWQ